MYRKESKLPSWGGKEDYYCSKGNLRVLFNQRSHHDLRHHLLPLPQPWLRLPQPMCSCPWWPPPWPTPELSLLSLSQLSLAPPTSSPLLVKLPRWSLITSPFKEESSSMSGELIICRLQSFQSELLLHRAGEWAWGLHAHPYKQKLKTGAMPQFPSMVIQKLSVTTLGKLHVSGKHVALAVTAAVFWLLGADWRGYAPKYST